MKKIFIPFAVILLTSGQLFAETVRGSVQNIDSVNRSVTIAPQTPGDAWANKVNLNTENAQFDGFPSIADLEVGDQVIAEGTKVNEESIDVTNLRLNIEEYNAGQKLGRGLLNIISSPVEIARSIQIGSREENLAYGWTIGLLKGFGNGAVRFGAGVIDVVTFPFEFPTEYKAPLIEPEFVWDKPGIEYV